eukprot:6478443-Amphidinium_carterae.2
MARTCVTTCRAAVKSPPLQLQAVPYVVGNTGNTDVLFPLDAACDVTTSLQQPRPPHVLSLGRVQTRLMSLVLLLDSAARAETMDSVLVQELWRECLPVLKLRLGLWSWGCCFTTF